MVESMRAKIEALGGEYRFGTKVDDSIVETGATGSGPVRGVVLEAGETIEPTMSCWPSAIRARDTFHMLHDRGVYDRGQALLHRRAHRASAIADRPRALRRFRRQPDPRRGRLQAGASRQQRPLRLFSFCMCPGGTVVAATSEPGRVVTNGMSQYSRAERNANAGIVVGITPEVDYPGGPLAGIAFQRHWESRPSKPAAATTAAPAQRVGDFLAGRPPPRSAR
jgi:uncharacterized protein